MLGLTEWSPREVQLPKILDMRPLERVRGQVGIVASILADKSDAYPEYLQVSCSVSESET